DIRKDCLYCDAPTDLRRMAYRSVLDTLFHALVRYIAPVLEFTAEEAWTTRYPDANSVHLLEWPKVARDDAIDLAKWEELRRLRERVNEAIEPLRHQKLVGSGLEAEVTVPDTAPEADLAELFITARVTRAPTEAISVTRTTHHKCGRCWRHLPEVAEDGALCSRCDQVVAAMQAAA
ncbi:MAG: class I tRNA ligase family protein, partial [Novosphingobium sp.]|nr:class I tRNA ligase family protein [Novosphingobium sp.]